jgi:DNA (cytosine-5)-methyltransferase 1
VDKFLSKWKRIERDKPCYTLTAHMALDTYSHIHPWEPRGISVREAARIQSFPDDYVFQSNMGEAFRQIGNSVPPLMARGIATALRKMLGEQEEHT